MTTIIAIETPDGVKLGYDSKASGNYDGFHVDHQKFFRNGKILYGVAGKLGFANALKHASIPALEGGMDPDVWVTNVLTPSLRELVEATEPKRTEDGVNASILVVVKGRVYEFTGDLSWTRRVDGMYAIGSGREFATGALAAGASIRKALKIAATYDLHTGYELVSTTAAKMLAA